MFKELYRNSEMRNITKNTLYQTNTQAYQMLEMMVTVNDENDVCVKEYESVVRTFSFIYIPVDRHILVQYIHRYNACELNVWLWYFVCTLRYVFNQFG